MRVELSGVTKRFGAVEALSELSCSLASGCKTALIGPNGSGKSTLTRVLMGLVDHRGEVLIDGRSPRRHRVELARRMAYVPQIAPQLAAPVRELLRAISRVRALELSVVGDLAAALGLELSTVERRPFRELSGGTKQKLLIAMALAAPFSLLILDEPTASLDPAARERFYRLYHERARESTVVLCSHRIEEVRHLVDHVVALDEGRLAYDGSADAFLGRRAISQIELHVPHANGISPRLRELGFAPGVAGWWIRRATRDEKLAMLPRLSEELGPALRNVVVRDLESVEGSEEPR